MIKFKDLEQKNKHLMCKVVLDSNVTIASLGLLGFAVHKLAPTKENFERFQKQFTDHPLCGCTSCIEIGKTFVLNDKLITEEVIAISMVEVESTNYKYVKEVLNDKGN